MNFTPENTHDLGDYQGDFGDFGDFGIWSHFRILELLLNLGLKFRVPTKNSWWFGSDRAILSTNSDRSFHVFKATDPLFFIANSNSYVEDKDRDGNRDRDSK